MTQVSDDDVQVRERLGELIRRGTDTFGGGIDNATGGLIGLAIGGPPGAIAGAAVGAVVGTAFRRVGGEISARLLAPREEARVGYVFALAAKQITERLEAGEEPRTDGFFGESGADRSDAEEVWESILLKSQREPEERKLPYMAHLMANVAFEPGVSSQMAHQLIKDAERLTYRQMCILRLAHTKEQYNLRKEGYREFAGRIPIPVAQILYEFMELLNMEYLASRQGTVLAIPNVVPAETDAQGFGSVMFLLMRLDQLPDQDISEIAKELE